MSLEPCPECGLVHPGLVHAPEEVAPLVSDEAAVAIAEEETEQAQIAADAMVEVEQIRAEVESEQIAASVEHHEIEAEIQTAAIEAAAEVETEAIEAAAEVAIAEEESEVAIAEVIVATDDDEPEETPAEEAMAPSEEEPSGETDEAIHVAPPPRVETSSSERRKTRHRSAFTARHSH